MGGKTSTATSSVSVPENVKAMYNSATNMAQTAASHPFQEYSQDPNAFVAGLTGTQQAAMQGVNAAQGVYQPFYNQAVQSMYSGQQAANPLQTMAAQNYGGAYGQGQQYLQGATQAGLGAMTPSQSYNQIATGFGLAGAQGVNPGELGTQQINKYMSPYLQNVVAGTLAPLQQQQQMERSRLLGNSALSGALGGSGDKVARAILAGQQNMATGNVVSGLLNQGYGQALQTAQQQQGLGLSAEQANRAALQQAAGQMAALGQQGYGQQMGLANLLQGLGAQGYQQGMGLGQAQQGLGQQVFGQGQAMAQGLQGLGSGALQNELASRQAQMGMGTAEQQTQQAGLQALYNQFLQQQGYPFQVAQFLTNQMSTLGPLFGTTTAKTVPANLLGKVVARGGAIKRASGGLVPSSEGGAVSPEYAGLGFAAGGSYSPETLNEILQMQKAMFPFAAETGSRVGGGTGPHGIGLIPANPRPLEYAELDEEQKQSLLDKLSQAESDYEKGRKIFGGSSTITTAPASYRGGVAGSSHYASGGGLPYDTDVSYVPEQEEQKKSSGLLSSDLNSSQGGGLAGDLVKLQTLASIMGYNQGGLVPRHHYADGGNDEDVPSLYDPNATPQGFAPGEQAAYQADLTKRAEEENKDPDFVNRFWKTIGRGVESLYGTHPGSPSEANSFAQALGRADVSGEYLPVEIENTAAPTAAAPTAAAPTASAPTAAASTAAASTGIAPEPLTGNFIPSAQAAETQPSADARNLSNAVAGKTGDWFSRNKEWLLPLAKGVGATLEGRGGKFLPASLLKGATVGALSVPGLQEQAASVTQQQEAAKAKQLSNADTAYKMYLQYKYTASMRGETPVSWPEFAKQYGVVVPYGEQAPQGAAAAANQPQVPGKVSFLGNSSKEAAQREGQSVFGVNAEAAQADSQRYAKEAKSSGLAAAQNTLNTNEIAKVVSENVAGKNLNAPGTAFAARAELVRAINTMFNAFGFKQTVGEADTQADLLNKYSAFMGSGLAQNADQNSLGALQAMMSALPQGNMTPAAQIQVASQLMVSNQEAKDRQAHLNQYNQKTGGLNSYYNAQQAFEDDNRSRYLDEQEYLKRLMTNPSLMKALTSGAGTVDQIEINLEEIAKQNGIKYVPGMSRYFVRQ